MRKIIPVLLCCLFIHSLRGQNIRLKGNVADTAAKQGLSNVLLMAIKFNDSTLINYTRSNANGQFNPITVPIDTYIVILSHPSFSDKTYLVVPDKKDSVFNFKNVVLPPKSVVLNEVEVIAYRDKSYYKGDTLVFTADSFKTQANATVEDLLKKLPGVRVDAKGKITIQGKEVDQVLVDGDEFFGSDPTVATRNLNATAIENVQVYDKKNESAEEGKSETLKVVNLQMKEDAKKGYFGKISGASDFQKFYENELMANRFKGNKKLSVFGIFANTPKQAFGWNDANRYGLTGETPYTYDEETNSWNSREQGGTGIPQTLRTGIYFSDNISKKTKINTDYTFSRNVLESGTETNTQFFLADTSYTNSTVLKSRNQNMGHNFNFSLTQKLDSLTELRVIPKIKYGTYSKRSEQTDVFISELKDTTRSTRIFTDTKNESTDANVLISLNRSFKKKDRKFNFTYQPVYSNSDNSTRLNTDFLYFKDQLPDSSINQDKSQNNYKMEHNISLLYTEPITKKFKAQVNYGFTHNQNNSNKKTYDYGGSTYDLFNPTLSNNFENKRLINRAGLKLIYDVKKYKISIGSNVRNIQQENLNVTSQKKLTLNVNNILPNASFVYRFSQSSNLDLAYTSSSQQPDLMQMQPVIDNSDPNRISIGNPDLKPTFNNNLHLNYYFYKGISDVNLYLGANGGNTNNQISYFTTYDSLGRAVTQPINVNGNYNANMYIGGGHPLFKRFLKVYYNFNGSYNNNISFVNGIKNASQNTSLGPNITFEKDHDKVNVRVSGNYNYNLPKSNISIQSNQPYYSYGFDGNITLKLPGKFSISSDGNYTNNGNRTPGYNLNYFILNASIDKKFLKNENLVVSFIANDILNQNISNQRYITSNQIVDTKTQIIRRYFLLKVLLKFNNQKTKEDDEDY